MKKQIINGLHFEYNATVLVAKLCVDTMEDAEKIAEFANVQCEIHEAVPSARNDYSNNGYCIVWKSSDVIDLVAWLQKDTGYYNELLAPIAPGCGLMCKYKLTHENATPPVRAHPSDSGFDLTLIQELKSVGDVTFYDTGVQVSPPHGYYFNLVPRSSISKTGYMLANSIGVIDQNYRGNIIVPLRKVHKDSDDIELPAKVVQIVPMQWYHVSMLASDDLENTERGEGGFGSTS